MLDYSLGVALNMTLFAKPNPGIAIGSDAVWDRPHPRPLFFVMFQGYDEHIFYVYMAFLINIISCETTYDMAKKVWVILIMMASKVLLITVV